jgi:HEPN domain-containing protein
MVYKTAVGYVEFSRWLVMARRTLESTRRDAESGDFNWACFKAHQAAEFAAEGLPYGAGRPARGHSVYKLLETANELLPVPKEFLELGKLLDKFYIRLDTSTRGARGCRLSILRGATQRQHWPPPKRFERLRKSYGECV